MVVLETVCIEFKRSRRASEFLTAPFRSADPMPVLRDITFAVRSGDGLAILGPSGSGKTTLLRVVAGLIFPCRGKVTVGGHDTIKENSRVRQLIGYVPNEERSFYWRLSGLQNLEFFGALENLNGKGLREKARYLLDLVGLDAAKDRKVAEYSSGMRQRLAVARAIIGDPSILILDEPTKSLDPDSAENIWRLLKERVTDNLVKTLLLATHHYREAELLCSRTVVLENGIASVTATTGAPAGLAMAT